MWPLRRWLIRILVWDRPVAMNLEYGGWVAPKRDCRKWGFYANIAQRPLSERDRKLELRDVKRLPPGIPKHWFELLRPPGV